MVLRSLKWARDELGYADIKIPTVKMPSISRGRDRRISPQEEHDLLAALHLTSDVQKIVSLAIETGMRRSEITNMRWSDVKLKNRTLHIPQTKTDRPRTIFVVLHALLDY
jgi:integrase